MSVLEGLYSYKRIAEWLERWHTNWEGHRLDSRCAENFPELGRVKERWGGHGQRHHKKKLVPRKSKVSNISLPKDLKGSGGELYLLYFKLKKIIRSCTKLYINLVCCKIAVLSAPGFYNYRKLLAKHIKSANMKVLGAAVYEITACQTHVLHL